MDESQIPTPTLEKSSRNPFRLKRKPDSSASTATLKTNNIAPDLSLQTSPTSISITPTSASTESAIQTPSSTRSNSSFAQKTFEDARHFAGGIIKRPSESTKHFSIVRHSHGLVFYQGVSTSLAVTIFADEPLPADRKLWLQSKGWTGKTGMKIKASLGITGKWLDVTPTMAIAAEQLEPSDERAWQRDIKKFLKKAPSKLRDHIPRETLIFRIPAAAGDGYFQVNLCVGDSKKVLCSSPPFRVLSTSMSPHSVKGAGLTSLPLELGAMAITTYGKATVGRVISPVSAVVHSEVVTFLPTWWARKAAHTALGAAEIAATAGDKMIMEKGAQDEAQNAAMIEAVLEEGPQAPFPIRFSGRSKCNASDMDEELELTNFALTDVEMHEINQLQGYYFGWARQLEKKAKDERAWCQAMISVVLVDTSQIARVKVGQKALKSISVRLLDDPEDAPADNQKFEIQVLGLIRPDEPVQRAKLEEAMEAHNEAAEEAALISETNDVSVAEEFLNHPSWTVEAASRPKLGDKKTSGVQKLAQGYTNTRTAASRRIEKVPFDKFGVRIGDKAREKDIAVNGFYVVR